MKKTQFEEIIFSLAVLIALYCYVNELRILCGFFTAKAIWDFFCLFMETKISLKKKKLKLQNENIDKK